MQYEDRAMEFLLAGAAIGALLRSAGVKNVGCQGEVGVAAAMAAAGYASVGNGSNAQVLFAAERALEPHLGLACDPSGGRIETPCIARNARAAAHAYQAAVTAVRVPAPRVGLDLLTRSIVESGHALSARYKSSSIGGVAVNVAEC
jgi:L-serine dehydratase